ncbi:MAG: hypothetical protein M1827_000504 [Pycnora praestabilis]|nr:MAG: hypothetical protein M1827_000504 [Pycnora praestabilis]
MAGTQRDVEQATSDEEYLGPQSGDSSSLSPPPESSPDDQANTPSMVAPSHAGTQMIVPSSAAPPTAGSSSSGPAGPGPVGPGLARPGPSIARPPTTWVVPPAGNPNNVNDRTSFHPNEVNWSLDTLPAILGQLEAPTDWRSSMGSAVPSLIENGHPAIGLGNHRIRNFPFLPRHLASWEFLELFRIEAYFRYDPRLSYQDLWIRMVDGTLMPSYRQLNALNNRRLRRVRRPLNMLCWTERRPGNVVKTDVETMERLSRQQIARNTSWDVTPEGIVQPQLRGAPGLIHRIPFPPGIFSGGQQVYTPTHRVTRALAELTRLQGLATHERISNWSELDRSHFEPSWSARRKKPKSAEKVERSEDDDGEEDEEAGEYESAVNKASERNAEEHAEEQIEEQATRKVRANATSNAHLRSRNLLNPLNVAPTQYAVIGAADRARLRDNRATYGPLPAGWGVRLTPDGRLFFANRQTRTNSWDDPRVPSSSNSMANSPGRYTQQTRASANTVQEQSSSLAPNLQGLDRVVGDIPEKRRRIALVRPPGSALEINATSSTTYDGSFRAANLNLFRHGFNLSPGGARSFEKYISVYGYQLYRLYNQFYEKMDYNAWFQTYAVASWDWFSSWRQNTIHHLSTSALRQFAPPTAIPMLREDPTLSVEVSSTEVEETLDSGARIPEETQETNTTDHFPLSEEDHRLLFGEDPWAELMKNKHERHYEEGHKDGP